jgi:hypothetical protein
MLPLTTHESRRVKNAPAMKSAPKTATIAMYGFTELSSLSNLDLPRSREKLGHRTICPNAISCPSKSWIPNSRTPYGFRCSS